MRARYPDAFRSHPARRARAFALLAALLAMAVFAAWALDFNPRRIWMGLDRLGLFVSLLFPPDAGGRMPAFLKALGETLAIAFLGTLTAALVAFPVAFLAAKNVVPNVFVHFSLRRVFDVSRSVDTLIWALMWINVVGLGPFAGALAIACSDFGAFGKLFSEAIEAADRKPAEGILAAGGSGVHRVRFALLPQVLPVMASQVLYFFESNTRSATIIGIVGAGGIGGYLTEFIRTLQMQEVCVIIIMILLTVAAIDFVSSRLRFAIIGRKVASA
ncbi:phosphonate ABC transporter, permease protein PhnE [Azorhizobium doebereinerae]|uniref:phosphonate ABC transporter, permease protein PhnE n=1 Tax=Azorhizobium doebereinerae TaxID=281091 RepID=UPI000686D124|nr:phosphonate ABC transporter, permease protein PhnE [Azorhizobium doebereinerae]